MEKMKKKREIKAEGTTKTREESRRTSPTLCGEINVHGRSVVNDLFLTARVRVLGHLDLGIGDCHGLGDEGRRRRR